jgi:soluble lytic murein transglycosylase
LQHNNKKLALHYLDITFQKAYYRFDRDKVNFWRYLITNNINYLYELQKSTGINMYKLLALDKLNLPYPKPIYHIPCQKTKDLYDIKNPFMWVRLLDNINSMDKKELNILQRHFNRCETLPQKAFILERVGGYKKHYFIKPFYSLIKHLPAKQKSFLLSIARQESRFITSAVSHSWALGMMQFMPFLAKATAKQKNLKWFQYTDMFKPKIAYNFAKDHILYLKKALTHPLFISYAYNGGIGFTKRMLKAGFFKKGKYEPYLSMELVPYAESRKYGKKVMANYIMYLRSYGRKETITPLLKNTLL